MDSEVSKYIRNDLCRIHGITKPQALEIVRSEFDLLKQTIESYSWDDENYPTIRLPKWGLFFVKPSKKKDYDK